jgi:hypothetical protein
VEAGATQFGLLDQCDCLAELHGAKRAGIAAAAAAKNHDVEIITGAVCHGFLPEKLCILILSLNSQRRAAGFIERVWIIGHTCVMGIFRSRKARTDGGAVVSDRGSNRADLEALREFASSRRGVEAWIEPKTSVTQATLLLVAHDGESLRRRVSSPQAGYDFARKKLQIPVYDSNLVPIPGRKREYDLRQVRGGSASRPQAAGASSSPRTQPKVQPKAQQTPRELRAIMTLESIAGVDPLPANPTEDQLMRLYKKARSQSHPDRLGGDRDKWDTVEDAARALGLPD